MTNKKQNQTFYIHKRRFLVGEMTKRKRNNVPKNRKI